MNKFEEQFHFDKRFEQLQSKTQMYYPIVIIWVIVTYSILYYFGQFILTYLEINRPFPTMTILNIGRVDFMISDIIYFVICGLMILYGARRLVMSTVKKKEFVNKRNETSLLTTGPYSVVRHPMYGAFVLMHGMLFVSFRTMVTTVFAIIIIGIQFFTAYHEEKKQLIPKYKETYLEYRKNVTLLLLKKSEWSIIIVIIIGSIIATLF